MPAIVRTKLINIEGLNKKDHKGAAILDSAWLKEVWNNNN